MSCKTKHPNTCFMSKINKSQRVISPGSSSGGVDSSEFTADRQINQLVNPVVNCSWHGACRHPVNQQFVRVAWRMGRLVKYMNSNIPQIDTLFHILTWRRRRTYCRPEWQRSYSGDSFTDSQQSRRDQPCND